MQFTQIRLKDFRNYRDQTIDFHPKINIISGKNAQGKTNILEGLYIMSLGKSFRTNRDSEMIRFGVDFCSAKSVYIKSENERNLEVVISKYGKSLIIDGYKAKKNSEFVDNVYIVAFTPEDMKIVKDEPEKRRRYIDREICQIRPIYYMNLISYRKALVQRNALLKQENIDNDLMDIWERKLAEYGSKIIIERIDFMNKVNEISRKIHNEITEGREKLELFYETSISGRPEDMEKLFIDELKENRKGDLLRGSTRAGPHRDDIKIIIDGIDVRNYGSQGQQRTAALSLKLAEIKIIENDKKESPVLLLDDVLSELDEKRQEYLLKSLSDIQLFITTAENKASLFREFTDRAVFNVDGGRCVRTKTI
jgi:DNA replication and repair protein RecF